MAKIMRCAYRSEDALSHTSGEVGSGSAIVLKCVSVLMRWINHSWIPSLSKFKKKMPPGHFTMVHPVVASKGAIIRTAITKNIKICMSLCRSQWPRGLRRRSAASGRLRLWVWNPPGHGCMTVVSIVCVVREDSSTSWSLVQRSPIDCSASLCMIEKPRKWGCPGPPGGLSRHKQTNMCLRNGIYIYIYTSFTSHLFLIIMSLKKLTKSYIKFLNSWIFFINCIDCATIGEICKGDFVGKLGESRPLGGHRPKMGLKYLN